MWTLTQLPFLYFNFSLLYLCFLGYWIFVCFKNRQYLYKIHSVMSGLLVMTFFHLICAGVYQHYIEVTVTPPHGWNVLFYISQFIRTLLFFTVMVLIGTGWCFWKPFLQRKEKLLLMNVILLQVLVNAGCIFIAESGPHYYYYYDDKDYMLINWKIGYIYLLDFLCCLAIFFPIVWSLVDCETDANAARFEARLESFVKVVTGYLFITRTILHGVAVYETGTLVFCIVVFYIFRPSAFQKDQSFVVDENTWDEELGFEIPNLEYFVSSFLA